MLVAVVASVLVALVSIAFGFVIKIQHDKIQHIYELIRHHPELKTVDSDFSKAVSNFAAPFWGWTNRVFLPVGAILVIVVIFGIKFAS